MELAFAGLHALCAPMLGRLGHLPARSSDAAEHGVRHGGGPRRIAFCRLAVLSLLADAAEEQPPHASSTTAVARSGSVQRSRRGATASGGRWDWFRARESRRRSRARRTAGDVIEGLAAADAGRLLDATVPSLDARVRDWILGEAGGNPLALLELPRERTTIAVPGGFGPIWRRR